MSVLLDLGNDQSSWRFEELRQFSLLSGLQIATHLLVVVWTLDASHNEYNNNYRIRVFSDRFGPPKANKTVLGLQ